MQCLRPALHPGDRRRRQQLLLRGARPLCLPTLFSRRLILHCMRVASHHLQMHDFALTVKEGLAMVRVLRDRAQQVLVSDGRQFVGTTPTSPFAQLGLAQRTVDVLNGMQASN